jgi:RHS repeat-associated protein
MTRRLRTATLLTVVATLICTLLYQAQAVVTAQAASSVAWTAFTGGSNPVIPYTPPSTQGVDDSLGLFYKTYTDFSVPGLGPGLDLTRTYLDNGGISMFGYSWTSSYNMEFGPGTTTGTNTVIQEDGSPAVFQCGKSGCLPGNGLEDSLTVRGHSWLFTRGLDTFTFQQLAPMSGAPYQLTKITDSNGHATTLAYNLVENDEDDDTEQLSTVTDSSGRTLTFTWNGINPTSTVSSVTGPLGRVVTYGYNSLDDILMSVTQPGGQVTSFTYVQPGNIFPNLKTITDPNGGVTSFTYNCNPCPNTLASAESVASITDPMGLVTTFAYSENTVISGQTENTNEVTTITDPDGVVSTNTNEMLNSSDGEGDPSQDSFTVGSNLPNPSTTTYVFTAANDTFFPSSVTDPDGHATSYTYTQSYGGDVASVLDALSRKTSYTYNSLNEILTTTDPLGIVDTNTFDADGNLTKKTLAADSSCSTNCTLTATDTVCESATCTVGSNKYLMGQTESVTDADGHVTSYTYDSYGDVATTTTNPSSGVTDTTQDVYDAAGELVCEASPNAVAAGVACPAAGGSRVANTTTSVFNADGEVTSSTDPDGNVTSYTYDGDGNQLTITDGLGNVTATVYDKDSRVSSVTDGYGTSAATTTTDTYNILAPKCPSPPTGTLYCTQTANGLGNTTTSYYNGLNQVIETAAPNTTEQTPTTYTYDLVGNDLTMTNGSGTTTNTYDADNELKTVAYSNTQSGYTAPHGVTYSYDADGNRTQMVDGTGTTTYTYDGFERLISVKNGAGNTVTYGYDPDSNVTCLSYPNSGTKTCATASSGTGLVTYAFDGAGELTTMTDWLGNATGFAYDHDSNLTTTTLPSGTATSVADTYDNTDALTGTTVTISGTPTVLDGLTRNADKNIATTSAPATTYGYDALNRVTTGTTASYGYDAASELTSITPTGGSTTTQAYNADGQLCWTGVGSGTCSSPPTGATIFGFNSVGERTGAVAQSGATASYGWDQAGNLLCETAANSSGYSCASPNSSVTSTFAYNGDGLRLSDTPAGGAAQQFIWNTRGSVPLLLQDGSSFYLYGTNVGAAPIEQIKVSGSTPSYLLSDSTGVREQLASSGSVTGAMSYDTFGKPCSTCSISTPFGFAGGYTDTTGFTYLIHRYYEPATGQFLSIDPLSNPLNQSDLGKVSSNSQSTDNSAAFSSSTTLDSVGVSGNNTQGVLSGSFESSGETIESQALLDHLPLTQESQSQSLGQLSSGELSTTPYGYANDDPVNLVDPAGALPFPFDFLNELLKTGWEQLEYLEQEAQEALHVSYSQYLKIKQQITKSRDKLEGKGGGGDGGPDFPPDF